MNDLAQNTRPIRYKLLYPETQQILHDVIMSEAKNLTEKFYSYFLKNEEAAAFLSHDDVRKHLAPSMEKWLHSLFDPRNPEINHEQQRKIGKIHAQLGIPIHLVLRGAILLKNELGHNLVNIMHDSVPLGDALLFACNKIDKAMALMSAAYVTNTKRNVRTVEAYRVMSLGQDMTVERESQLIALMEWSQNFLFTLIAHDKSFCPLSNSAFGLWLRHRAIMLFENTPELDGLIQKSSEFDQVLLPEAKRINAITQQAYTLKFQAAVQELKYLLTTLFQRVQGLERGIDPLTSLLNRRFLPTILSREVSAASHDQSALSIVMLDIDHFKNINDTYGHPGGDRVLKQVAERIQNTVRPSDFLFRYGGEEFLIILTEIDGLAALKIAERLRETIENVPFIMPDETQLTVTASLGVANYDGHPDPDVLISNADRALYKAKQNGRNQVAKN
ncbi:GGDEF domain-containing protein [Acetobacter orientalis]|uniref:GGDEF domain-containing protein n=1 Tax=Acetobacter orientalis TaxID=146474 RepID=UPI0034432F70